MAKASEAQPEFGANPWLTIHRRTVDGVEEVTEAMTLSSHGASAITHNAVLLRTRYGTSAAVVTLNNTHIALASNPKQPVYSGHQVSEPVVLVCSGEV